MCFTQRANNCHRKGSEKGQKVLCSLKWKTLCHWLVQLWKRPTFRQSLQPSTPACLGWLDLVQEKRKSNSFYWHQDSNNQRKLMLLLPPDTNTSQQTFHPKWFLLQEWFPLLVSWKSRDTCLVCSTHIMEVTVPVPSALGMKQCHFWFSVNLASYLVICPWFDTYLASASKSSQIHLESAPPH